MELQVLQRVIRHIEEHLREDKPDLLDNAALAKVAGLSVFHFLREFRAAAGLSAADYIRKRRISEIVKRMGENRPMSDIAFEYGFNSKEHFTRAFKKEHGVLPSAYKRAGCSLRLYEPLQVSPARVVPAVSLGYLGETVLTVYPFSDLYPPTCWNLYNTEGRSSRLTGGRVAKDHGVRYFHKDTGKLDYFIGVRKEEAAGDKNGTAELTVPAGLYAVFETPPAAQHNFSAVIRDTWEYIREEWFPESGYLRKDGFELETYTEESRTYTETIYIPIERKKDHG